jgi:hypothetical protein
MCRKESDGFVLMVSTYLVMALARPEHRRASQRASRYQFWPPESPNEMPHRPALSSCSLRAAYLRALEMHVDGFRFDLATIGTSAH